MWAASHIRTYHQVRAVKVTLQRFTVSCIQLNKAEDMYNSFPNTSLSPVSAGYYHLSPSALLSSLWHSWISVPWKQRQTSDTPQYGGPTVKKVETSQAVLEASSAYKSDCITMSKQYCSVSSLAFKQRVTPKSWSPTLPSSLPPVPPAFFFRLDFVKQIPLCFIALVQEVDSPSLMRTPRFV